MKKPITRSLIFSLAAAVLLTASGWSAEKPAGPAKPDAIPLVGLWVAWNDLALALSEIDNFPTEKLNMVEISFYSPLRTPDKIAPSIKRLHERGLKVIAFMCMEFFSDGFEKVAALRGEPVPPGLKFQPMLNADGSTTLKSGTMPITSLWDPAYRHYVEEKIRFLKTCGADMIHCGELGYTMSEKRDFNEAALVRFVQETGATLPTTKLGKELEDFWMKHAEVRQQWRDWKYRQLHAWIATLGVDGVGRHIRNIAGQESVSPAFPGGRLVGGVGGFGAEAGTGPADYAAVEKQIRLMKVPCAINLGGIQFAVGNTGKNIEHAEDIARRAVFLAQRLEGFVFYGSSQWKRYKQFVHYLPDLKDYPKLKATMRFNDSAALGADAGQKEPLPPASEPAPIFRLRGKVRAAAILSGGAKHFKAAKQFADLLGRMTSRQVVVVQQIEAAPRDALVLHVGDTPLVEQQKLLPADIHPFGFIIRQSISAIWRLPRPRRRALLTPLTSF